jgi:hypothetical protein
MSANLIKKKWDTHTIEDDLKSSFYVVFWVALMYTDSYMDVSIRLLLVKQVFKAEEINGVGSNLKSAFLILRRQIASDVFVGCQALDKLIVALAKIFAFWYIVIDNEQQAVFDKTFPCLETAKGTPAYDFILMNLNANPAYKKHEAMEILRSHSKIIAIYDEHLALDAWLPQEVPKCQLIALDDERCKLDEFFTKSRCPTDVSVTSGKKRRLNSDSDLDPSYSFG